MVIIDLIQLAAQYESVIYEGDINIDDIIHIVIHAVTISNYGTPIRMFDRQEKGNVVDIIMKRDISDEEKEALIHNAYEILGGDDKKPIREVPQ